MSAFTWLRLKLKQYLCATHKWDGPEAFGRRTCRLCGVVEPYTSKRRSF